MNDCSFVYDTNVDICLSCRQQKVTVKRFSVCSWDNSFIYSVCIVTDWCENNYCDIFFALLPSSTLEASLLALNTPLTVWVTLAQLGHWKVAYDCLHLSSETWLTRCSGPMRTSCITSLDRATFVDKLDSSASLSWILRSNHNACKAPNPTAAPPCRLPEQPEAVTSAETRTRTLVGQPRANMAILSEQQQQHLKSRFEPEEN